MSAVTTKTVTIVRHEYRCQSPACWADVKEAMAFAARDRETAGLDNRWDDVIKVESVDDEIVVFWVESKP